MQQRDKLSRWIFVLSAAFLLFVGAFAYGYVAGRTKIFPHPLIARATLDVEDVLDLVRANAHEIHSSRSQGGVIIHDATLTQPGLTFLTAYTGRVFQPLLIDMDGKILHRWNAVYSVLFKGKQEIDLVWDSRRLLHGSHLYPDGSVVVTFESRGTVKLDRCSRPVWLLERRTHHAILPLPDGSFWTGAVDEPRDRPRLAGNHREESILHVSADGEVLEEINLIDAILKGGYEAILLQGEAGRPESESVDPLHLNDIELVTNELAARVPQTAAGDFLVSLQHTNALAIVSRRSKTVVWSMVGPFLRQHDPDIVNDGTLLVFDNRTDTFQHTPIRWLEEPQTWGYSRLVRIDPVTQQVLWSFKGSKSFPFYTSAQGKLQLLANGNILVADPEGGRAFEISPAHANRVVWEYVNALDGQGEGMLGRVSQATRYDYDGSGFLGKPCP
jgi:Arylsulfotransferase (ASST)